MSDHPGDHPDQGDLGAGAEAGGGFDVRAECPACGAAVNVSRIRRGSTEPCPVCSYRVPIPSAEGREGAPPQREAAPEQPAVVAAVPEQFGAPPQGAALCTVCARDDVHVRTAEAAGPISSVTGRPPLEVKLQLVRGMGILAEGVAADTARTLVERLEAQGVPAFAVAQRRVPRIARDLPMLRILGAGPGRLQIQTDARGGSRGVGWGALAAGFCTKRHVVRGGPTTLEVNADVRFVPFTTTSPVAVTRRTYRAARREPDPDIECTFLLRGKTGNLYSLRFTEKQVRYTYLGPKIKPSSAQNFGIFLTDVIRHCPHAFFPAATRAVAAGDKLRAARLKREGDNQRYLEWVLCCLAARRQGLGGA